MGMVRLSGRGERDIGRRLQALVGAGQWTAFFVPADGRFQPGPAVLTLVMIVIYFVVLGRAGGTVFQRLFGMKRATNG